MRFDVEITHLPGVKINNYSDFIINIRVLVDFPEAVVPGS